jgi:hypothetical protein
LVQHTKTGKNVPKKQKNYQRPCDIPFNIATSSNARPSKIYPNWDFLKRVFVSTGKSLATVA